MKIALLGIFFSKDESREKAVRSAEIAPRIAVI